MRKVCVYLLKILLCVGPFIGCGTDIDEEPTASAPAVLETIIPANGSTIAVNGSIALTFDKKPENFTIDLALESNFGSEVKEIRGLVLGASHHSDKTVIISGPFPMPVTQIKASWGATPPQQSTTLTYTVVFPTCCGLLVTGGSIKDGDKNVNPEAINSEGKIEITLSEDVTGNIALQTEAGEDVGWLGKVNGSMAVLELVKGRDLEHETTYIIVGNVFDTAGDELWIKITFVTRSKA